MSSIFSEGWGASDMTGVNEEAPCSMYLPDKYSNDAPGTLKKILY